MKMKESGAVNVNGYSCMFTQDGQWAISRHGTPIGYVATLSEVESYTTRNLENIRKRLQRANEEAAERGEQ
jgi:hypothetical protein